MRAGLRGEGYWFHDEIFVAESRQLRRDVAVLRLLEWDSEPQGRCLIFGLSLTPQLVDELSRLGQGEVERTSTSRAGWGEERWNWSGLG